MIPLAWVRRAASLHDELAALADVRDPRWWLVAGAAALDWTTRTAYVASDAEPASDTFIGLPASPTSESLRFAIARAHAARIALRELDGELPGQPLAVTVQRRDPGAAIVVPSSLRVAAFAIGGDVWCATLASGIDDEHALATDLAAVLCGDVPRTLVPLAAAHEVPFVCISLGDEPLVTARHGHRRAWLGDRGPWLGVGRSGELVTISTCHFVIDGYGHAWLAARIEARAAELAARGRELAARGPRVEAGMPIRIPPPAPVSASVPLAIVWREVTADVRAVPLAYALGCLLHELAGDRQARFSPTVQIPVAPGAADDPLRVRRRVIPAIASVRFERGRPEPYAAFAARTRQTLAREAGGAGLTTRLLAGARALPMPLAWKRRAIAAERPRWLAPFADVIGGRGCVSRIELDVPLPPACAVSSPARMMTPGDPLGGCVVTVMASAASTHAAITLCGSGEVARSDQLDALLARLPTS